MPARPSLLDAHTRRLRTQAQAALLLHAVPPIEQQHLALLAPIWARRAPAARRAVTSTTPVTVADDNERCHPPPPPLAELPNLPLDGYLAQAQFHHIDASFPGLQLVHERPFIFCVQDFLSERECDALMAKMAAAASSQLSDGAASERGRTRTSRSAVLRNDECAAVRARLARLAAVSTAQLQPLKVTRYAAGARFSRHTDAYLAERLGVPAADVAAAPERFPNRFVTVFVYLDDVARGGRTRWRWLREDPGFYDGAAHAGAASVEEVSVRPRRGMAVVHLPCTASGTVDPNAQHESEEAVDVKHVVQQFIWARSPDEEEGVDEAVRLYWRSFAEDQPDRPLTAECV